MENRNVAGVAASILASVLCVLATAIPVAAQGDQKTTICEATGSPTNPWVFTTIDARDLDEHLARGDRRATSIADCTAVQAPAASTPAVRSAATPTPAPTQTRAPSTPVRAAAAGTPAPTATATVGAVQQQGVAVGIPDVSVSRLAGGIAGAQTGAQSAATSTVSGTPQPASTRAAPTVGVAGTQATPSAQASTLPKSGGEPNRNLLVLACLAMIGTGLGVRRLARAK
jgi:hypothetical protein